MRTILAGVLALVLAGCGLRYTASEEQMQQVARGAAELMKKDPYSGVVTAAGTGAHVALSMALSQPEPEAQGFCVKTLTGCRATMDYGKPND
ncbi:hypothetical protein ACIP1U_31190 [Cupriavidus sp. NPDC089707]|uniref:hypothetical protein n=1 Tax=Cupriavidus sp. NPDC089707 TaxID=3363963 RepID=UPI003804ECD5